MNKFQVKNYVYNSSNSAEQLFYKKHRFYPEQIYIKLRQLGFNSNTAFTPIQKEMDRLFALQKQENEFEKIAFSPFE